MRQSQTSRLVQPSSVVFVNTSHFYSLKALILPFVGLWTLRYIIVPALLDFSDLDMVATGTAETLIGALVKRPEVNNLTCVSNNAGVGEKGLGKLLLAGQIQKMISSYLGRL